MAAAAATEPTVANAGSGDATQDSEKEATSADYYFDSYSHFGIHEVRRCGTTAARSDCRP